MTDILIGSVPCSPEQMATVIRALATHHVSGSLLTDTAQMVTRLLFSEHGDGLGLNEDDFREIKPDYSQLELHVASMLASDDWSGLELPPGANTEQARIRTAIMTVLEKHGSAHSGGCRVFYTPAAWAVRGEEHGTNSMLIVVHDGGAHAPFFNYDYEQYGAIEEMRRALQEIGCYTECCTSWYSAVYPVARGCVEPV